LEDLKEGGYLGDLAIDGRIILKFILSKWDARVWTKSLWLRIWPSGGSCEHANEHSGLIKGGDFLF
jgi:hypothetical protein